VESVTEERTIEAQGTTTNGVHRAESDERPSWYDVPEAAAMLGISQSGAYKMLREKRFPVKAYKVGVRWHISAPELDELVS
jgi:excisionase family DNA binding protein